MRLPHPFLAVLSLAALLLWWLPTRSSPGRAPASTAPEESPPGEAPRADSPAPPPLAASAVLAPEHAAPPSSGGEPRPLVVTTPPALPEALTPGVLRHWQGTLLTPLRARAPGPLDDIDLPLEFEFPLDGARRVAVLVHRLDVTGPDAGVFSGTVPGHPGSSVVLSYVGLAQSGVIHLPELNRAYVIHGDERGRLRITETDPRLAPGCTPPLVPPEGG